MESTKKHNMETQAKTRQITGLGCEFLDLCVDVCVCVWLEV